MRGKGAAAGVANDVVEKALRAIDRAVLVVDYAVGMVLVSCGDETGGRDQFVVVPGTQLQPGRQIDAGRGKKASKRPHHEKPAVNLEARLPENAVVEARRVQQQLRLHALHLRRVHKQLQHVA